MSRRAPFAVSILDFVKRREDQPASKALAASLKLAQMADAAGFARYWVTEHHQLNAATSAPEVVIPWVAENTRRIRVGSGGVLLRYYSPLKVAEKFRCLSGLYPGRIDLGVGRSGATAPHAAALLNVDVPPPKVAGMGGDPDFRDRAVELVGHIRGWLPPEHRHAGAIAHPADVQRPPVWVLGSNVESAGLAAELGTPFAYALFYNGNRPDGPEVVHVEYTQRFVPSQDQPTPHLSLGLMVVCAKTRAEAERIVDRAPPGTSRPTVVGAPEECAQQLRAIVAAYGAQEVVIGAVTSDPAERHRSYALLGKALGLEARAPEAIA